MRVTRYTVACDTPGCLHGYVDGRYDDKCSGTGQILITDTQERQSVREAISGYLGALHRVAEALGKVGRQ